MIRRSQVTLPHSVLSAADVVGSPTDGWHLNPEAALESTVLRDGDRLQSWDALAPLRLFRSIAVASDWAEKLGLCQETSRLRVVVIGSTGRGIYREVLQQSDIPAEASPLVLDVQPRSDRLLRNLQITTSIVVVSVGADSGPLAPATKGARVWEETIRIHLEGGRARLPMEVVSFRHTPAFRAFANALFHVHVTGDSSTDVEQGLLVHLNADCALFVSNIEAGEEIATAVLWEGVVREVLCELVAQDLIDDERPTSGTLGELATRWSQQAFPGLRPSTLAKLARERPAEFDAVIGSWCGSVQRLFKHTEPN